VLRAGSDGGLLFHGDDGCVGCADLESPARLYVSAAGRDSIGAVMRTSLYVLAAVAVAAMLAAAGSSSAALSPARSGAAAAQPAPVGPASPGYVYWTNTYYSPGQPSVFTIGRASLGGTGVNQSFIPTVDNDRSGLAVDAGHIYWTNQVSIGRANRDGTAVNQSFITAFGYPYLPSDIAVDAGHIYWVNWYAGTIGRANLGGTGVNQNFIIVDGGAQGPNGVAVDAGHVYWVNWSEKTIGRANLDGTGVNQSFIAVGDNPHGVAVDAGHVYWANAAAGTIGRANLDGTGVNQSFISGAGFPTGLAVDAGHVYWANLSLGTIGRANLNGTGINQSFITGASRPWGLAVAPAPTAASVSAAVVPSSVPADGVSTATVTATLTDTTGNGVVGDWIGFSSTDPGQSFGPVSDNGDGTYTATLTASTTVGTATITATDNSVTPNLTGQATLLQTAMQRPTVTSVSPGSGYVTGGTPITITGSGFTANATVAIGQGYGSGSGAIPATSVVVSPTQITAMTGGGAKPGSWNLLVTTQAGTSPISAGDLFSYHVPPKPTVSAVTPKWGPLAGGTRVTVTGTNFVNGAKVLIGQGTGTIGAAQATNVVVVSPTEITATTAPGTQRGNFFLYVTTAGGTSAPTAGVGFNYTN
jgi:virginiamycin B lyase